MLSRFPDEWLADRGSDPCTFRAPESEKLGLELMVKGYTINSAYPFRLEDQAGSIESGKLADLIVLGENLSKLKLRIYQVKATAVILEGEFIHREVF